MKINVTPDEFFNLIALYLLERFEERKIEMKSDTEDGFVRLSEDGEDIIKKMGKRNLGPDLRKFKMQVPIVNRNKYNFIKKAFKGEALSDYIITIKGNKDE